MGAASDPKDDLSMQHSTNPLPAELQGQIGKKIREEYSKLVAEPVPDRFLNLLNQLKSKETGGKGEGQ